MKQFDASSVFRNIVEDNFSGSSELLHKLNHFLIAEFSKIEFTSEQLEFLKSKFRSFTGIRNFLDKVFSIETSSERYEFLTQFASDYHNKIAKIANHLRDEIGGKAKILSISNSFTLLNVLKTLHSQTEFEIVISESRPMNEGRIMASRLARIGVKVSLCTEAQIPNYLEKCTCALVGADAVLPDGSIVNKTGSRIIALCCSVLGKPFYVISDSAKQSRTSDFDSRVAPASEIWDTKNSLIVINNYYFEKVESNLITKIIID